MNSEKQARREKMEGKNAPGNVRKSNSTAAGAAGGFQVTDPGMMQQAQQMSVGGKMNNSPQNVKSMMYAGSTMDMGKGAPAPYEDGRIFTDALTTVMPQPASGMQAFAPGTRLNSGAPIGMQQQPPSEMADQMQAMQYNQRNMFGQSSMMGPIGLPATPAPGGSAPTPQQTANTLPPQGVPNAEAVTGVNMKTGKRGKA